MTFRSLTVDHVSKAFGATRALSDVSFTLRAGAVHGLVGENGAGKSTLLKIISGVYRADSGTVAVDGTAVTPGSMTAAEAAGIQIVHQELALFPHLTVAQNICAGRAPRKQGWVSVSEMERRARAALARLGADIDVRRRVEGLPTADQQFVELARGLVRSSNVLILDEPTAALPPEDARRLLAVLRELAAGGMGIAFVSHRLDEVMAVTDEVTVLKDGAVNSSAPTEQLSPERIVSLMVGRELADLFPPKAAETGRPAVLSVQGLVAPPMVRGVDVELHEGEIVGLYGLEGSGQDEVLRCLAGDLPVAGGRVSLRGRRLRTGRVGRALRAGVGFVPPDRKHDGLLLEASGIQNISLPVVRRRFSSGWWVRSRAEHRDAAAAAAEAGVRGNLDRPVVTLSGGNQQKVLLSRLLLARADVLLLNQPTRGVDVGAKAEIYRLIRSVCDSGRTALVVSPEITELLGLCDRIVVIGAGSIRGEVDAGSATEEQVLALAVAS